jgi:hypothetical protein
VLRFGNQVEERSTKTENLLRKTFHGIMAKYLKDAGWKIKDKMQIQ